MKKVLILVLMIAAVFTACGMNETDNGGKQTDTRISETPDEGEKGDEFVPDGNVNPLTGLCDGISDSALEQRPVAIMVSNSYDSLPQWGISQADIIYEMLAEGRITRLLAIFKDPSKIEKLASIRSSRPYFIDIAQSYGAVYMHFGGSVPAYNAIAERKDLISIDGIKGSWEGTLFFRDPERRKTLGLEHSVYTTGEYIENALASLNKDLSQAEQPSAFSFASDSSASGGSAMSKVSVTYSERNKPYYVYDASKGTYLRYQYGDPHMDAYLGVQIEVKNLLVLRMETTDVAGNALKLVEVKTNGSGEGYYFCNGKYIPITWEKNAYNEPISFYDAAGSELKLERGKTFVSVVTEKAAVDIE
ncbi:MAG: DUF3048 domain-containing protein [Clostridiaceae bacterium]|nr:DUF3048 domain-containing protein [Clostridiaceae bacterium]